MKIKRKSFLGKVRKALGIKEWKHTEATKLAISKSKIAKRRERILLAFCEKYPHHWINQNEIFYKKRPVTNRTIAEIQKHEKRISRAEKRGYDKHNKFQKVLAANKAGALTLKAMGEKMGVTRERVRQIILEMPESMKTELKRKEPAGLVSVEFTCPCGKKGVKHDWVNSKVKLKTRYCDRACLKKYRPRKYFEKGDKERAFKNKYNTDEAFRLEKRRIQKLWRDKREKENPALREHRLAVMRNYAKTHFRKKREEKKENENT